MKFQTRRIIVLLYLLAGILLLFSIGTFLYQYVAALGSTKAVVAAFGNDRILSALVLSLLAAFATTFLAVILGVPLAYVLAMRDFRGKSVIETLSVDVPQTFPPVAEGMIFLLLLGPTSPFHVNIAFTFAALVVDKLFISAPFVVSFAARRFREVRKSGIHLTARSLGASPAQVLTTVLLPLSWRDIAAGTSLCWSRAMGELGGSLVFAGVIPFKTEIIPSYIATQAQVLTVESLAATILVTTASTLALISFRRLTATGEKA